MKHLTPIVLTSAALVILSLMFWPKVIVTIGIVIMIVLLVACCFAPFFINHPACSDDTISSQPAKTENHNSASNVFPT